jgi:type IV pilus assembly protein PilE
MVTKLANMRGFTLVELMVTLLVVAILISIAVPTYNSQTRKSRRTEARTALLDIAAREERLFSTTNGYSATASALGYNGTFPMTVASGYYSVSITIDAGPPAKFTLTASPVSGKGQDKDSQCNTFTVEESGDGDE